MLFHESDLHEGLAYDYETFKLMEYVEIETLGKSLLLSFSFGNQRRNSSQSVRFSQGFLRIEKTCGSKLNLLSILLLEVWNFHATLLSATLEMSFRNQHSFVMPFLWSFYNVNICLEYICFDVVCLSSHCFKNYLYF